MCEQIRKDTVNISVEIADKDFFSLSAATGVLRAAVTQKRFDKEDLINVENLLKQIFDKYHDEIAVKNDFRQVKQICPEKMRV